MMPDLVTCPQRFKVCLVSACQKVAFCCLGLTIAANALIPATRVISGFPKISRTIATGAVPVAAAFDRAPKPRRCLHVTP